jgi:glycosyltransferase involved in cell wall biosynthesis
MAHIGMVLLGDIRYDGRVRKEIGTLRSAGHDIELVVADFRGDASGGEDLGVKIHYIPTTLHKNPLENFFEQILFNRRAASVLQRIRPSHVHCHDLASLLAGRWAKKKLNAQLVFDAHELKPESLEGIRARFWGYVEKSSITSCDRILMPEKNRITYFKKKYPHIPEPLLLENFPRERDLPAQKFDLFRSIYPIEKDQCIILYTGSIAPQRYVEELIESMVMCESRFTLIILGRAYKGYEETLQRKIRDMSLTDRAFLHPAVPHSEILQYMASCDIGLAFYRDDNINNYYCASNKLYEYIALEKSILTNNYPGLLEVVERFKQGLCLDDVSPRSLAKAYPYAIDPGHVTPGVKKFFWEDEADVLTQLYE